MPEYKPAGDELHSRSDSDHSAKGYTQLPRGRCKVEIDAEMNDTEADRQNLNEKDRPLSPAWNVLTQQ